MNFEVGSIIEGKVVKIKPFGALVLLSDNVLGLVHISHIAKGFVQDVNEHVAEGDTVMVKILSIDTEGNRLNLSMKEAIEEDGEDEDLYKKAEQSNKRAKAPLVEPAFEEKFKDWVRSSNERIAGINKRNKRR